MDRLITLHNDKRTVFASDLHGDYLSLQRIIRKYKLDGNTRFVFLGDYIDRGDFSFEVVSYLYNIQKRYPDLIHLLHGNHEGDAITPFGGDFWLDVRSAGFREKFLDLPYAVELGGIVATHGALPLSIHNIKEINSINIREAIYQGKPLSLEEKRYFQIVWGDFYDGFGSDDDTLDDNSLRTVYTEKYLDQCLANLGKNVLIRGHQPHLGKASLWGGKLITVISTSLYSAYYGTPKVAVVEAGADTTKPSSVKIEEVGADYVQMV